jgi:hypothetical protein
MGVQKVAACASDLDAVITRSTLAFFANQRTYAIGDVTDSVERLEAGNLGV